MLLKNKFQIIFLVLLVFLNVSCSKTQDEPKEIIIDPVIVPPVNSAQKLSKISQVNATGIETISEFSYDSNGKISLESTTTHTFTPIYNSKGQIISIAKIPKGLGEKIIYVLEYDADSRLIKQTRTTTSVSGAISKAVSNYEYNPAGKLNKLTTGEYITAFTWIADNLAEMKGSNLGVPVVSFKTDSYDDKTNPFYSIKSFIEITHNTFASKNNPINNLTAIQNGTTTNFLMTYLYNSSGNVSQATTTSSSGTSIVKYYY